jgi:hypothetical protein
VYNRTAGSVELTPQQLKEEEQKALNQVLAEEEKLAQTTEEVEDFNVRLVNTIRSRVGGAEVDNLVNGRDIRPETKEVVASELKGAIKVLQHKKDSISLKAPTGLKKAEKTISEASVHTRLGIIEEKMSQYQQMLFALSLDRQAQQPRLSRSGSMDALQDTIVRQTGQAVKTVIGEFGQLCRIADSANNLPEFKDRVQKNLPFNIDDDPELRSSLAGGYLVLKGLSKVGQGFGALVGTIGGLAKEANALSSLDYLDLQRSRLPAEMQNNPQALAQLHQSHLVYKGLAKAGQGIGGIFHAVEKGFEYLGTKVRRTMRDDLGFSQEAAQNVGDITEIVAPFLTTFALNAVAKSSMIAAGVTKFRTNVVKAFTGTAEGICDAANKRPYNSRAMESLLQARYSGEVSSHTLPGFGQPNVRMAGQHLERIVGVDPLTQENIIQRVVFDQRGFPIFDPYVKLETRISGDLRMMRGEKHMQLATQQLKVDILSGKVSRNLFSEAQLSDIMAEAERIKGFTWHHHQETGFGQPNVRMAGQHLERIVGVDPLTQVNIIQRVVFDQRGFPVFDPYVKLETRISGDLSSMSREQHIVEATKQLHIDIQSGKVSGTIFDKIQLDKIADGVRKIPGYTWHHHQETGRMQLVPESIHRWVGHVGGNDLWGIPK